MAIIALSGYIGSGKDTVGEMIKYLVYNQKTTNGLSDIFVDYPTFEKYHEARITPGFYDASGWEIKKFAYKLKQIASILTGIPIEKFEDQEFKKTYLGEEWNTKITNPNISLPYLQIEMDKQMSVREFLQKLGTEGIRDGVHTNAWVNALFADYKREYELKTESYRAKFMFNAALDENGEMFKYPNWIITDCRFPNEAKAVKERHGVNVRIKRKAENGLAEMVNKHESETALDDWEFDYVINNDGDMKVLIERVKNMLIYFKIL